MIMSELKALRTLLPRLLDSIFKQSSPDSLASIPQPHSPSPNLAPPSLLPLLPTALPRNPIHHNRPNNLIPELRHQHIRPFNPLPINTLCRAQVPLRTPPVPRQQRHDAARARRRDKAPIALRLVDPAREQTQQPNRQRQVQRVENQRRVGRLPHLRHAVGYQFEGGGFVGFGAGDVRVQFGDAG